MPKPHFALIVALSTISQVACQSEDRSEMTGQRMKNNVSESVPPVRAIADDEESAWQAPPHSTADDGVVEQAVAFYSDGSLINAQSFPLETDHVLKIIRGRNRPFAAYEIIKVVSDVGQKLASEFPGGERLQIGDVANLHGGQAGGHGSHQNGLDIDIAWLRVDRREQSTVYNGFAVDFVTQGRVSANFDVERNWALIKYLIDSKRVIRIFVDRAIKDLFCRHARRTGEYTADLEYLRRQRIEPLHDDHMHVRVRCPKNSPRCEEQVEVPVGSGC